MRRLGPGLQNLGAENGFQRYEIDRVRTGCLVLVEKLRYLYTPFQYESTSSFFSGGGKPILEPRLSIGSGDEWLLLSVVDMEEALQALKAARVPLGDRSKLRNAKKLQARAPSPGSQAALLRSLCTAIE